MAIHSQVVQHRDHSRRSAVKVKFPPAISTLLSVPPVPSMREYPLVCVTTPPRIVPPFKDQELVVESRVRLALVLLSVPVKFTAVVLDSESVPKPAVVNDPPRFSVVAPTVIK